MQGINAIVDQKQKCMSNWLEEAEIRSRREELKGQSERLQVRIDRVRENYQKNQEVYDAFIGKIKSLINRANALPAEFREPFGKIKYKTKQTRLNNYLNIFSSSRHIRSNKSKRLWAKLFPTHFKHIRVVFINVSKHLDKIDLEIRQDLFERKRINEDGNTGKHHHKNKKDHIDLVIHLDIILLNDELAQKILDFLAFRCELNDFPIPFEEAIYY